MKRNPLLCPAWTLYHILCFFSLVCFAACEDGSDSPNTAPAPTLDACLLVGEKVFDGEECFPGASPVVRIDLVKADTSTAFCTGTVIGKHAVLTAAHCFLSDVVAVRLFAGGTFVGVQSYSIHPQFMVRETFPVQLVNDVAIVFTHEEIPTRTYPLLASRNVTVGEEALVAGYGKIETGLAGSLHVGNTFVSSVNEQYLETEYLLHTANPCEGDSGGPLLVIENGALTIAGIVSRGTWDAACQLGDITMYVNVRNETVAEFILSAIEDYEP